MNVKSSNSRILFNVPIIFAMLLLVALPASLVFAANTGFFSPSFAAAAGGGPGVWLNPSFTFDSDDQYASAAGKNKTMHLQNFGISPIQGNSTIDGIEMTVEGYTSGTRQVNVSISGDGGLTWSSAKTTTFTGAESVKTLGGAADTWGLAWSSTSFTNANFKVKVTTVNSNTQNGTIYIDHVQVKVHFQPPDTTLTVSAVSEDYGIATTTLTATLTETNGGAVISGKTVEFTLDGVPVGDAVTDGSGVASLPDVDISTLAAGVYEDAIVASFAGDAGYDATFGTADLTIVGIPLTVTADPQTRYYGFADPTLTYQYTGDLLPGDSFNGNLLRDPGEDLGDYFINQGTLTAGPGYSITYIGDFLTIEQAPLTVTADNQSKLDTDLDITNFTFSYSGFVLGENASALTTEPTCALEGGADQSVLGVYAIICDGGVADNYFFNYVNGTLTVSAVNTPPSDITLSNNTVQENRSVGAAVGALTNDDPDLGDTFTYSLVDSGVACPNLSPYTTDNASFAINGDQLETAAMLNFEAKNSYEICIQVDDGNGGLWQKEFTITVLDLPEIFRSAAKHDGWIRESSENSGRGGTLNRLEKTMNVGDDAANKQYRAILSFNTAGLPDNAVITKVTLRIKYAGVVGTLPFNTHGKLLADIRKGAFSNRAALQLADFKSAAQKNNAMAFTKNKVNGWYSRLLSSAYFQHVNLTGLTQFRLRFAKDDNNDLGADYLKIYSGNAPLGSRPQLLIEYYVP